MDIKESDLSKEIGLPRAEFKLIRKNLAAKHELGTLWYREDSKKPEHLRSVFWTDVGIYYLRTYLSVKAKWNEEEAKGVNLDVMTKEQFANTVNNTMWVGKVTRNKYKNKRLIMVEHEIGYQCNVNCKDNANYSMHSYVVVDSKNSRHSVRKPQYKSYEKALKDCKRV